MKDYLIIIGAIILGYLVIGCLDILRTKKIINSNVSLTVKDAYDILYDIVKNCVLELNQTIIDQLKKDGEFGDEQKASAKELAILKVKNLLSDRMKNILNKYLGDENLDTYIGSLIESVIYTEKSNKLETITLESVVEKTPEIDPYFGIDLGGGFSVSTTATNSITSEQGEAIDEYLKDSGIDVNVSVDENEKEISNKEEKNDDEKENS